MTLTGFKVPYSYMYRKYINYIHSPFPSLFTLLLLLVTSLYHGLFYIPVLHCLSVCFLHWYFTCKHIAFNQSNPSVTVPYKILLARHLEKLFFCGAYQ
jgi:hypothetical protein